jgi:hypothetical protein
MTESAIMCCVRGCANLASLQHRLVGQFFEYHHSYCGEYYEKLARGDPDIGLDRDRVPLLRLERPTEDWGGALRKLLQEE